MINKFIEISKQIYNEYLQKEKESGKKLIGYVCLYIPEELLHAAGLIPVRLRVANGKQTTKADTYFSTQNCSYVRQCFEKALDDEYGFLDGVVLMNSCDHLRRMYDNWVHSKSNPQYIYMLPVPHKNDEECVAEYVRNLYKLKESIETTFNVKITNEALASSIILYNRQRQLLLSMYNLRKSKDVPIKGHEFLSIMLALSSLPVEVGNSLLEGVLTELEGRVVSKPDDIRIFLGTNHLEEPEHLKMIEDLGGIVVADNTCFGYSCFNELVQTPDGCDYIKQLAIRYLSKLSCPRMQKDYKKRLDFVKESFIEYKADAAIIEHLKFCAYWAGTAYLYKTELEKFEYPVLSLDRNMYEGSSGQIKTRIQALFEGVRNRKI